MGKGIKPKNTMYVAPITLITRTNCFYIRNTYSHQTKYGNDGFYNMQVPLKQ